VVKNDLTDIPLVRRTHTVAVGFHDFISIGLQPVLGFGIAFSAMDMDRLVAFIGMKEKGD
jgi:hypothetical protein